MFGAIQHSIASTHYPSTYNSGLCCCVALLDHRYPQCWGCHRYSQMCCCVDETVSCKPLWFSAHNYMKRKDDQCCLLDMHRCNCMRTNGVVSSLFYSVAEGVHFVIIF